MGFLLIGKGRRSGKTKRPAARGVGRAAATTPRDPARAWRMARGLLVVVLLGGGAVAAYLGQGWLENRIADEQATLIRAELTDTPPWLGAARADELRRTIAALVAPDPMDRASLTRVAGVLADNPWVASVNRVERGFDGVVSVSLVFREPVALVEARDGYHLVDGEGRRLPGVYPFEQLETLGLPALVGVRAAPPPEGQVWPGDDVQSGLSLAKLMAGTPWATQVRAVDVRNAGGRVDRQAPYLSIATAHGVVRWGRAPGEESIYEPAAEQKLAMLGQVAGKFRGRIDAGGRTVDVFLDRPMLHSDSVVRYTSMP